MARKTSINLSGTTVTIEVNQEDLNALAQRLSQKRVDTIMQDAMGRSTDYIANQINKRIPTVTGDTSGSLQTMVYGTSTLTYGKIISDSPALSVLEYGRAPGQMPPPDRLEEWAEAKLGQSGLGYVIARAIGRNGIRPRHIVSKATNQSKLIVESIFRKAFKTL